MFPLGSRNSNLADGSGMTGSREVLALAALGSLVHGSASVPAFRVTQVVASGTFRLRLLFCEPATAVAIGFTGNTAPATDATPLAIVPAGDGHLRCGSSGGLPASRRGEQDAGP